MTAQTRMRQPCGCQVFVEPCEAHATSTGALVVPQGYPRKARMLRIEGMLLAELHRALGMAGRTDLTQRTGELLNAWQRQILGRDLSTDVAIFDDGPIPMTLPNER